MVHGIAKALGIRIVNDSLNSELLIMPGYFQQRFYYLVQHITRISQNLVACKTHSKVDPVPGTYAKC